MAKIEKITLPNGTTYDVGGGGAFEITLTAVPLWSAKGDLVPCTPFSVADLKDAVAAGKAVLFKAAIDDIDYVIPTSVEVDDNYGDYIFNFAYNSNIFHLSCHIVDWAATPRMCDGFYNNYSSIPNVDDIRADYLKIRCSGVNMSTYASGNIAGTSYTGAREQSTMTMQNVYNDFRDKSLKVVMQLYNSRASDSEQHTLNVTDMQQAFVYVGDGYKNCVKLYGTMFDFKNTNKLIKVETSWLPVTLKLNEITGADYKALTLTQFTLT
jgi:hypothetical protein